MENRRDLTTGSVGKKLFLFAMPIFIINLLQAVYNIVDMIIVGRFMGSTGMSAVSIGGQVTTMILSVCNGLSNGGAAYIGQLFGAGKMKEANSLVGTLLSFLMLLALAFTALILIFLNPLLNWLNTPGECYGDTALYLAICMGGTIFIYVYNSLAAALRGVGESFTPMLYVLITTVENIFLDLLFVAVFDMGAPGTALATVICQFTSMVLVAVYVKRRTSLFDFRLSSFRIYWEKLSVLIRIGLPQAIQFTSTNISFLLISSMINVYGVSAAAAAGAADKIRSFGVLPGQSFMSAIVTLTAQNHPRGDYKRIIRGMFFGMAVSMCIVCCVFLACQISPATMYGAFTSDKSVAEIGITYLRIFAICFFDETIMFCLFGVLTGSGYTTVTMVCSLLSAFGVRYVFAYILRSFTSFGFNGIALAYSCAPLVGIAIASYFIVSGRWKISRIKVK